MRFNWKDILKWLKKHAWYIALLVASSIYVIHYRFEIHQLKEINAQNLIFILWLILLLFPLFSEMEFLGVKLKREIVKSNNEIKDAVHDLQLQIMQIANANNNNVRMSKEEVYKLESEYGVELRTVILPTFTETADGVTVLGDSGCSLYYDFTADDKMDSMAYFLTGDFDNYYTYLKGKYGDPVIDRYGQFLDIGEAPNAKDYIDDMWIEACGFEASNANYTQWWYPVGEEGYIDILLMRVNLTRSTTTNRYTTLILSYTYRTNEEKDRIMAELLEEAERTKDDLEPVQYFL